MNDLAIDIMFYITYLLLFAAVLGAIVFPIINLAGNPKKAKTALMGIGAVAVVFLISYVASSSEVLPSYEKYGITSGVSKVIGATLVMTYILGAAAIVSAIAGEIYKAFK